MFDLMQKQGFPSPFRNWVAALWRTSSSWILLNGVPGNPIPHRRRLRQGDPLPPLLFVLAIDPLQQILDVATAKGDLQKLRGRGPYLRTSLYADDAPIFLAPSKKDVDMLTSILQRFGGVTGLVTNVEKSLVAPIRCLGIDLDDVLSTFPAVRS